MVHLVTYEFVGPRLPGKATRVEEAIKALGPCYAFHKTAWFVESELNNREISERLVPLMRPHDRLIATRIHRDWIGANIAGAEADWLGACNFASAGDEPGISIRRVQTIRS